LNHFTKYIQTLPLPPNEEKSYKPFVIVTTRFLGSTW